MKTLSLSEAKDRLSSLVDDAEATHEMVTITKHGRPAAVLMAAADLESLEETVFWLSQPHIEEDVAAARHEDRDAGTASSSDVRAELGLPEQ